MSESPFPWLPCPTGHGFVARAAPARRAALPPVRLLFGWFGRGFFYLRLKAVLANRLRLANLFVDGPVAKDITKAQKLVKAADMIQAMAPALVNSYQK